MRRVLFIIALLGIAISSSAEDGVTFQIEELSKPTELLKEYTFRDAYDVILYSMGSVDYGKRAEQSDYNNILYHSVGDRSLVLNDDNPFFNGMREAYANHRPVVLSPDMIWMLISQGFSHHLNFNSEKLKDKIVKPDIDTDITAYIGEEHKDKELSEIDWIDVISQFADGIAEKTNNNLYNTLVSDFSTTTITEKVASQITIMKSVESYFDFIVMRIICGIPQVTLLGTPDDWRKVKDKTLQLEQYDLKWWTDRLIPILDEFIAASEGNANVDFWKDMVKIKKAEFCGDPELMNGWFITFYPYDAVGNRMDFNQINVYSKLPSEITKVSFDYKVVDTNNEVAETIEMEFWAGFFGWEQNASDYSIKPHIGWLVKQGTQADLNIAALKRMNRPNSFGIELVVDEVPEGLKEFDHIYALVLTFTKTSDLPDWLRDIQIDYLELNGKVSAGDRVKAKLWFDNVRIR